MPFSFISSAYSLHFHISFDFSFSSGVILVKTLCLETNLTSLQQRQMLCALIYFTQFESYKTIISNIYSSRGACVSQLSQELRRKQCLTHWHVLPYHCRFRLRLNLIRAVIVYIKKKKLKGLWWHREGSQLEQFLFLAVWGCNTVRKLECYFQKQVWSKIWLMDLTHSLTHHGSLGCHEGSISNHSTPALSVFSNI